MKRLWHRANVAETGRRTGARKYASVVGVFGLTQLTIAFSAVVRIPLIVATIGTSAYGAVVITGAVVPVALVVAAGLMLATRSVVAERLGAAHLGDAERAIAAALRIAHIVALCEVVVGLLVTFATPATAWLGIDAAVGSDAGRLAFAATILLCASACPGAVWVGVSDAHHRPEFFQFLVIATTITTLGITVAAALAAVPFIVFALLNAGSSVAPFWLARATVPRMFPRRRGDAEDVGGHNGADVAIARATRSAIGRAAAEVTIRGIDPFIVGAVLGSGAAADYSVAQRLSQVTVAVPVATQPLLTASYAYQRGGAGGVTHRSLARTCAVQLLIGVVVALVYVAIGPIVGQWLLGNDADVPLGLYAAFAGLGVVASVQLPIASAMTGPAALRASMWVDIACAILNIVTSITLAQQIGIAGPVVGSIIASAVSILGTTVLIGTHPDWLSEVHPARPAIELEP